MIYSELDVYKRAYKLAIEIHKFSLELPRNLQNDIGSQMRRASRSIPSQIAEGFSRNKSDKDKKNFLRDALGSNEEILFNLKFMKDINLINSDKYEYFHKEYVICGKQLMNLMKSIDSRN